MTPFREKLFDLLPQAAFLLYWLYAGLGAALVTDRPALLLLGVVTFPVLAAFFAAAAKVLRRPPPAP